MRASRRLAGVNGAPLNSCCFSLLCFSAEEQIHEEVAKRRRSLQRAGGGGGLPGRALCGVCSSAAGRDAGSPDGGSCSHKVPEILSNPDSWLSVCNLDVLFIHFDRNLIRFPYFLSHLLNVNESEWISQAHSSDNEHRRPMFKSFF